MLSETVTAVAGDDEDVTLTVEEAASTVGRVSVSGVVSRTTAGVVSSTVLTCGSLEYPCPYDLLVPLLSATCELVDGFGRTDVVVTFEDTAAVSGGGVATVVDEYSVFICVALSGTLALGSMD